MGGAGLTVCRISYLEKEGASRVDQCGTRMWRDEDRAGDDSDCVRRKKIHRREGEGRVRLLYCDKYTIRIAELCFHASLPRTVYFDVSRLGTAERLLVPERELERNMQ